MGPFTLPVYDKAQDLFAEACLNVYWYWNATFGQHEAGVYAPIESFVTKIAILDDAHYSEQHGQAYSVFKEGRSHSYSNPSDVQFRRAMLSRALGFTN